jgi:hypothetical protein
MDQINQLSPEQRQAIMVQAQQEANQQIMQSMMEKMISTCFKKCAGTSVRIKLQNLMENIFIVLLNVINTITSFDIDVG